MVGFRLLLQRFWCLVVRLMCGVDLRGEMAISRTGSRVLKVPQRKRATAE